MHGGKKTQHWGRRDEGAMPSTYVVLIFSLNSPPKSLQYATAAVGPSWALWKNAPKSDVMVCGQSPLEAAA